jgi:hypothetical protein
MKSSDVDLTRLLVETELQRIGAARTPHEIEYIVAERMTLERDVETCRRALNPLVGPEGFARRLRLFEPCPASTRKPD